MTLHWKRKRKKFLLLGLIETKQVQGVGKLESNSNRTFPLKWLKSHVKYRMHFFQDGAARVNSCRGYFKLIVLNHLLFYWIVGWGVNLEQYFSACVVSGRIPVGEFNRRASHWEANDFIHSPANQGTWSSLCMLHALPGRKIKWYRMLSLPFRW